MGAGSSFVTRDEAVAKAGAEFDSTAWDTLTKDAEGNVAVGVLQKTAAKYFVGALEAPVEVAAAPAAAGDTARRASVSDKYLYAAQMSSDHHKALEHFSAGGRPGTPVTKMEAPADLAAAELVIYKLGQLLELEGDNKTSGFGETYAGATINYAGMFKKLDIDHHMEIDRDTFVATIRRVLKITPAKLKDEDLYALFDAVDTDNSKKISLSEWATFARGARWASPYHHQGHVEATEWGTDPKVLLQHFSPEEEHLKQMPHYADKKAQLGSVEEPDNLDAVHLVLWHLAQHCAASKDKGFGVAYHPATVSFHTMYKALDLDKNNRLTRQEFALVLRKRVGVGPHVTDLDLGMIFDEMDSDKTDVVTLGQFAAFARGAATPTHARGISHMINQEQTKKPPVVVEAPVVEEAPVATATAIADPPVVAVEAASGSG